MPYETTMELPANIKKQYSDKAQEAFLNAFNAIMKQTSDEARAFAGAHSAARKMDGMVQESVALEATPIGEARDCSYFIMGDFRESPSYDEESKKYTVPVTLIRPGLSKNKVYYSPGWLSKFAEMADGAKAYLDHEKKSEIKDRSSRSVRDVAGWYSDVHQTEDGSVMGKLNLVETPQTEHVIRLAKANPSLVGLSINAKGKASRGKVNETDAMIAETIERIYSTDIVTEAAAGGEMESMRMVASVTLDIAETETHDNVNAKESETVNEDERRSAEWLMAESKYEIADLGKRISNYEWLGAEIEYNKTKSVLESKVQEVPEKLRPVVDGMTVGQIDRFLEAMKNELPVKKDDVPASDKKGPKPGEADYQRKIL